MGDDPFDALGVEASFDVDAEALRRAWLRRALGTHPDRAGGDEAGWREAASRLNEARRVLADPESRADALVVRLGGPAREEERGLPEGFLMEIMELREGLEGARASGDAAAMEGFRGRASGERAARMERVRELFERAGEAGVLREIRVELNAWRYVERMLEQIDGPGESGGGG